LPKPNDEAQLRTGNITQQSEGGPTPLGGTRDMTGQRVGPYEVVATLGQGGMGVVYLAHDTRLARKAAPSPRFLRMDAGSPTSRTYRDGPKSIWSLFLMA
jgi:serine/threonine protein kinase